MARVEFGAVSGEAKKGAASPRATAGAHESRSGKVLASQGSASANNVPSARAAPRATKTSA